CLAVAVPSCSTVEVPSAVSIQATPQAVPEYDWETFGRESGLKPGEDEAAAHLVAQAVARKFAALGILPNFDEAGREYARETFGIGNSSIGACGFVSRALRSAFIGAGVDESLLEVVTGRKPLRPNGLPDLSDFYNLDHAALIHFGEDGPVIYDLWLHGVSQGQYGGFERSDWCGASIDDWLNEARRLGYAHFTFHIESTEDDLVPPRARVMETWGERRSEYANQP
ncbi:MAG: hypothetical protein P1V35_16370, partial [Planctomycetota bacterium]|nr:hypothetical protein [Planctomycetota bacterium]